MIDSKSNRMDAAKATQSDHKRGPKGFINSLKLEDAPRESVYGCDRTLTKIGQPESRWSSPDYLRMDRWMASSNTTNS